MFGCAVEVVARWLSAAAAAVVRVDRHRGERGVYFFSSEDLFLSSPVKAVVRRSQGESLTVCSPVFVESLPPIRTLQGAALCVVVEGLKG